MTTNLPPSKYLKLGGNRYLIRHLDEAEAKVNNGLCCREAPLYIGIAPELTGPLLVDTVIHEILHAVMWERKIVHNMENVVDLEEFIVTNLASGLLEVLRSNPKVREWLNESIKKC